MSDLKVNLNRIFSPITLQRGREYFKKNKVNFVELDDDGDVLFGEVRGSGRKAYEVDVYLNYLSDEEPIEGRCSCPVEDNCKHAVALLLAGEKRYGARKLNELMEDDDEDEIWGFSDDDDDHEAIEKLKKLLKKQFGNKLPSEIEEMVGQVLDGGATPKISQPSQPSQPSPEEKLAARARELEMQRNRWLGQLKNTAKQHDTRQQALAKESSNTNIVLYVLEENSYHGGMIVQVCLSRYLKSGGYGKPTPYGGVYNCLHNGNWPASMAENDRRILRLAYINKRIDVYQGKITLNGADGHELLEKVLATGRCVVDQELKLPLVHQPAIQGEVRWQLDEQGLQRPQLVDSASGQPLLLIPSEPPCYLRRHHNEFYCGDLNGLPDIELLSVLLKAPPLDDAGIEETTQALTTIFPARSEVKKGKGSSKSKAAGQSTVALPEKVSVLTVMPKPLLRLDSIPMGNKKSDERLARATVSFDYDGQVIPFGSHLQTLKPMASDQGQQVIPRQMSAEHSALEQLPGAIEPAHLKLMESVQEITDLDLYDLVMGLPGTQYRNRWLNFMTHNLPELEEEGWSVSIDDNFPFQFEVINEDDWYAELDESDEPGKNNWFNLRLGITIDGQHIDLLPLLAKQINLLPDLDQLKMMDDDALVPVALPGGKFMQLPAGRLALIAGTLLELFGDRPLNEYQLQNYHAEIWQELYDQLGLPWAGGEKLLAIGKKLKQFKRLKLVNPAKNLQADLRDYQKHGLSWLQFLREYGLNGILADDMGLGKTLQTLAHIQLEKQRLKGKNPPTMVICPTSLLHNWRNEAERFTPDLKVHIHHGSERDHDAIGKADLVLTSYGVIQRDFEQLQKNNFHLLVLDEAQAVKNPKAKSAKAVRCLQAEHKLCLTGTPMENHLGELWSLFDFLMPGFLGAHDQFTRFYRSPIEKQGNKAQSKKLQKRVAPFMLRRGKDLVAKELPAKTEIIRATELQGKQRDLYETIRASMEARVKAEIENKGLARSQIVILDALLKMRQACCDPSLVKLEQATSVKDSAKLKLLMELVEPMVEEGRKILIFSQFTSMLSLIEEKLKAAGIPWVKLTGQTRNRKQPVDDFQNGDVPVFLISLKAGGTGLNLTAADTVIHYDPWWNPAVEEQASDRAHRIGQDKPVFVYKLVTEGTVEEKIQALKEKKKAIADSLYGKSGGKKKPALTAEDLNVLFEPVRAAE